MKAKNKLSVGDEVKFHSGNFNGLTGVITEVKYNVPDTPYGLKFTVKLSNGKIGYIEKAEHWHFV